MANLTVERELYISKDKNEYYSYFVQGEAHGHKLKAELMPKNKDYDGYEVLDIIFDIAPTAELYIHEEESETASGRRTYYTVYEVQNTDKDGITYSYKVRPRAESDKSVLNVLLQLAEVAERKAKEQAEKKAQKDKQ